MAVDYSSKDFRQSLAAIDAASRDGSARISENVRVRQQGDTTIMTEHRDPYSFYWQLDQVAALSPFKQDEYSKEGRPRHRRDGPLLRTMSSTRKKSSRRCCRRNRATPGWPSRASTVAPNGGSPCRRLLLRISSRSSPCRPAGRSIKVGVRPRTRVKYFVDRPLRILVLLAC